MNITNDFVIYRLQYELARIRRKRGRVSDIEYRIARKRFLEYLMDARAPRDPGIPF